MTTITLIDKRGDNRPRGQDFKIKSMVNTTAFKIGSYLPQVEVEALINQLKWKVIIK